MKDTCQTGMRVLGGTTGNLFLTAPDFSKFRPFAVFSPPMRDIATLLLGPRSDPCAMVVAESGRLVLVTWKAGLKRRASLRTILLLFMHGIEARGHITDVLQRPTVFRTTSRSVTKIE